MFSLPPLFYFHITVAGSSYLLISSLANRPKLSKWNHVGQRKNTLFQNSLPLSIKSKEKEEEFPARIYFMSCLFCLNYLIGLQCLMINWQYTHAMDTRQMTIYSTVNWLNTLTCLNFRCQLLDSRAIKKEWPELLVRTCFFLHSANITTQ